MLSRLFKAANKSKPLPSMDEIVSLYGATLAQHNGQIENIELLPVPKEILKELLLLKYERTSDMLKGHIIAAYIGLSAFQPLTGAEEEVIKSYNKFTLEKTNPDDLSPAQQHSVVVAFSTIWPAYRNLASRVDAECNVLSNELRQKGLM